MEISGPKVKKVLVFSQRKFFLYFEKQNFKKNSSLGGNFPSSKNKITHSE